MTTQWYALQYEYLWADGVKVKKPTRLPAPEYVNNLFDWIESQVSPSASWQNSVIYTVCMSPGSLQCNSASYPSSL